MSSADITILVVEDSLTQRMKMERMLAKNRFKVHAASCAEDALAVLAEHPVTLVISDIVMPGMNGYDLCRAIRRTAGIEHLPVILLTTLSDPTDIIKGVSCGANAFVTKPFEEDFLLLRIRYAVENLSSTNAAGCKNAPCIVFRGVPHPIERLSQATLDLLVSVYEDSILRNYELINVNQELERKKNELEDLANKLQNEVAERMAIEASLRESEERFKQLAITDALTGLYNKRNFFNIAETEIKRTIRHGHCLTAIMMDIDHFKAVNDTYGHFVGDEVLRCVAAELQSHLRVSDIVARYGGEEFVFLLPETDAAGGAQVAEKIRTALEHMRVTVGQEHIRVTSSFGVCCVCGDDGQAHEELALLNALIYKADEALYRSKHGGRNRVTVLSFS